MTLNLVGETVIATNAAGARYRGVVKAVNDEQVFVACSHVDIGHGWEREEQERVFRSDQLTYPTLNQG
jgi:hypothetical protein